MTNLTIAHTWDGDLLQPSARAVVQLISRPDGLGLRLFAPQHGDPAPARAPGPTPKLWEHEVVELFLLGDDDRYLEVEIGPHGHHLVLQLHGVRNAVAQGLPLDLVTRRCGTSWWSAETRLPSAWLPPGALRANAYRIAGVGAERRYYAHLPARGPHPDFHRLDVFEPLPAPATGFDVSSAAAALGWASPAPPVDASLAAWTASLVGVAP